TWQGLKITRLKTIHRVNWAGTTSTAGWAVCQARSIQRRAVLLPPAPTIAVLFQVERWVPKPTRVSATRQTTVARFYHANATPTILRVCAVLIPAAFLYPTKPPVPHPRRPGSIF